MKTDSRNGHEAGKDHQIGARIRQERLARRLTQRQLALAAGISVTVLRDLEQGRTRTPRSATMRNLAEALRLDLEALRLDLRVTSSPAHAHKTTTADSGSASNGEGLRVRVLGPLTAWRGNDQLPLGPTRQRAVLAVLALSPGQLVHRDTISDIIWQGNPPASAATMIQYAISKLRQILAPVDPSSILVTAGARYQLLPSASQLDLTSYTRLAQAAAAARQRGESAGAWDLYDEALALWTDEPVADIDVLRGSALLIGLRARHASLVADYAEDASQSGCHSRVLVHLHALTQQDVFDERAHACLMIALAGTGNQAAALATYDRIRDRLDRALGLAPGPLLRAAQARVLRGDYQPARAMLASRDCR